MLDLRDTGVEREGEQLSDYDGRMARLRISHTDNLHKTQIQLLECIQTLSELYIFKTVQFSKLYDWLYTWFIRK